MIIELLKYNLYICDNRKLVKMGKRNFKNKRKEDKSIDDSFVKKILYGKNDSTLSDYECSCQGKNFVSILEKDLL